MSKREISKKTTKKKLVNREGYTHWKSGKKVGPYKRNISRYPTKYITKRIDPRTGELRWVEITKSRGKISIKFLDQKPKGNPARPITFEEAREAFNRRSEKCKSVDLSQLAKTVYPQDQITSSYLTNPNRKDVDGLDTPYQREPKKPKKSTLHLKHVYKVDLGNIEGAISNIPTDIAPDQDKGIYLRKAIDDLDIAIEKYQQMEAETDPSEREYKKELTRIINSLKLIKVNLKYIPKNVPIDKDPGIYFEKAKMELNNAKKDVEVALYMQKYGVSEKDAREELALMNFGKGSGDFYNKEFIEALEEKAKKERKEKELTQLEREKEKPKEPQPTTKEEPKYIPPKDCAKLIREELKKEYPNVKFSVTTKVYSGGSSIDVKWEDKVSVDKINKIINKFQSAGYDPYQDIKTYKGTVMYKGKPVRFGADYVFAERSYSDKTFVDEANKISKEWNLGGKYANKAEVQNSKQRIGEYWLSDYVYQELRKKDL